MFLLKVQKCLIYNILDFTNLILNTIRKNKLSYKKSKNILIKSKKRQYLLYIKVKIKKHVFLANF